MSDTEGEETVHPTWNEAREIVHDARDNDKVIRLRRIGACPYFKFTPYTDNNGVKIHMWSCVSYTFRAVPEKTLLNHPQVVTPDDEYRVNRFTTEWLWAEVARSRLVELLEVEDSPFAGEWIGGWTDE